jgi:large exoprotein involved in heme utilization and adhesion
MGGDVSLDGGKLQAPGGRVELGGVAGSGTVGLNVDGNNLGLSFADGVALSDVSLTNGAEVNVRAGDGGSIAINARNLNISGASTRVRAGIDSGLGSVDSMAGDIEIKATEAINIDASVISNVVLSVISNDGVLEEGVGNGGNINITTGSLRVSNGAVLNASTYGKGNAGSVNINARDTVSFEGVGSDRFPSVAFSIVRDTAVGNGGNININARSLSITDGAQLSASTSGRGNSGSIFLQADDSVSLARNSAIFSKVEAGGVGNGGNINITAGSLSLTDGAQLQTFVANWRTKDPVVPVGGYGNAGDVNINVRDTITLVGKGKDSGASLTAIITGVGYRAVGNGGNINIRARELSLTNAQLGSDTRGQGDAGNVFIRVVDSIYLTTTDNVLEGIRRSRIGSAVAPDAEGNAGNIDIQARSLFLNNGSVLDATTQGNGNAGDIRVSANTLTATNGGQILTTSRSSFHAGTISLDITDSVTLSGSDPNFAQRKTRSEPGTVIILDSPASGVFADTRGGGGNINLYTGDLILRRGSSISTNARGLNITGGNITIYTNNLVAVPKEDSDISANAENSFGGRVIINAQGIFGTQFREHPTPLSDITATSALGPQFNGVVQLNTPGIDPSRGLTNLPTEVVDASNQIDQTCSARGGEARKNEFIVTGRRGLPSNPYETLSDERALEDIHPPSGFSSSRNSKPDAARSVSPKSATSNPKPPIVEAQGWEINDKGQVVLTATAPTVTPHNSLPASATCPSS